MTRPDLDTDSEADDGLEGSHVFLGTDEGQSAYREAMDAAVDAVLESFAGRDVPYSGSPPAALAEAFTEPVLPEAGIGLAGTLDEVGEDVLRHSVDPSHARCAAHLHCPPMLPGIVAETLVAASNQSLDSYDQAPAASVLEERVVDALCTVFDLPETADGVFTSGGTQSNFQALLLARDRHCEHQFGRDVQSAGLPPVAESLRILCSSAAHFTAKQAAHHLGLGEDAVVTVRTDDDRRIDVAALEATLAELDDGNAEPFAIVGTAGTTDFGSVDPLGELADTAAAHDLWLHVDAAYGGAVAVSDAHDHLLDGIERADSVAVDFHKLFFQPISCGAFLLRDAADFELMTHHAPYLNPESHDERGVPNLVGKSVQTTRRFDALKPYVAFRALGRTGLASLIDRTIELAGETADLLDRTDDFERCNDPTLNAVVFQYRPRSGMRDEAVSRLNAAVRRALLHDGRAIVARTDVDGVTSLKFTLMNPTATVDDVHEILDVVREYGRGLVEETEVAA